MCVCLHVNGLFCSSLGFPAPCALAHAPPPCPRGWQARIRRPSLFGREGSHEAPGRAPHRHALEDLLQLLPVRAARRAARNANVSRGGFGAGRARGCVCRSAQPRRRRVRGGPHTRPDCSRAETQRPPASSGPRRARRRRSRPVREEGRAAGGVAEASGEAAVQGRSKRRRRRRGSRGAKAGAGGGGRREGEGGGGASILCLPVACVAEALEPREHALERAALCAAAPEARAVVLEGHHLQPPRGEAPRRACSRWQRGSLGPDFGPRRSRRAKPCADGGANPKVQPQRRQWCGPTARPLEAGRARAARRYSPAALRLRGGAAARRPLGAACPVAFGDCVHPGAAPSSTSASIPLASTSSTSTSMMPRRARKASSVVAATGAARRVCPSRGRAAAGAARAAVPENWGVAHSNPG